MGDLGKRAIAEALNDGVKLNNPSTEQARQNCNRRFSDGTPVSFSRLQQTALSYGRSIT